MHGVLFWLSLGGHAGASEPASCVPVDPPDAFVAVSALGEGVTVEARYHGKNNFTGKPLPGYEAPELWVRVEVGDALQKAAAALEPQGYGLRVLDGYRPVRATLAMVEWTRLTEQEHLLSDGYIASKSGHNHGHTVDLTLFRRSDGSEVDMGSAFDHFGVESHHGARVGEAPEKARLALAEAMKGAGFRPYSKEWWHYRLPVEGTRPRDVPYGCEEPGEGSWSVPEGWSSKAYRVPGQWPPQPCEFQP